MREENGKGGREAGEGKAGKCGEQTGERMREQTRTAQGRGEGKTEKERGGIERKGGERESDREKPIKNEQNR